MSIRSKDLIVRAAYEVRESARIAKRRIELVRTGLSYEPLASKTTAVEGLRLNLGGGDRRYAGFQNVDLAPGADITADLSSCPWPWADSSVGLVLAHDLFEHLPDRVTTMNELHRVLVPGGLAEVVVPSATSGSGFAQDPTHRSEWTLNTFSYFEEGTTAHRRFASSYGIQSRFAVDALFQRRIPDGLEIVTQITALLRAVKG